jgi:hypothetical protein
MSLDGSWVPRLFGTVMGFVGGVVDPPTVTSCHCWLLPPLSVHWMTLAPSAVDAPNTSIALPLLRLRNFT